MLTVNKDRWNDLLRNNRAALRSNLNKNSASISYMIGTHQMPNTQRVCDVLNALGRATPEQLLALFNFDSEDDPQPSKLPATIGVGD